MSAGVLAALMAAWAPSKSCQGLWSLWEFSLPTGSLGTKCQLLKTLRKNFLCEVMVTERNDLRVAKTDFLFLRLFFLFLTDTMNILSVQFTKRSYSLGCLHWRELHGGSLWSRGVLTPGLSRTSSGSQAKLLPPEQTVCNKNSILALCTFILSYFSFF